MSWDYRIMRQKYKDGTFTYGIHEVYWAKGHRKVEGWTKDAMEPHGESLQELKKDYEFMGQALTEPVLDYKTGKPIEDK